MAVINIQDINLKDLEKIQQIVLMEEGVNVTLDETLAKILAFYRKFVPFN